MIYSISKIFILLAILPNMLVALSVALYWRRVQVGLLPLALLTLLALFTEIVCRVLWLLKISNLFILPVYVSAEFGLLVWLYGRVPGSRWLYYLRWPLVLVVSGLAALECIQQSGRPTANGHRARMLESLLVIGLTISYYHASLRQPTTAQIWREPLFWISTGLLFFFAGTFLIYTSTGFAFYYHRSIVLQLWVVHASLNALLYATYAYAIWLSPKS